jgi:hypothetical protein
MRCNLFAACLFLSLFILSCEETLVVLPEFEVPKTDRIVLIEEFTGVSCPNCPKGSAAIKNIFAAFPDKVAAVGIHGPFLAEPIKDKSKYDFRFATATELENFYAPFAKPAALVDRIQWPGEDLLSYSPDSWRGYVEQSLNRPLKANLYANLSYDETKRLLTLKPQVLPIENLSGSYKYSIYLTEGGLIDPQKDQNNIILNYEHEHVLRHMLTAFNGNSVNGSLTAQKALNLGTFTYTVPENFDPAHMEVIVVLANDDINDKSVIQATANPLKK